MNNLKKYNQILLAVFGSLAVLGLTLLLCIGLYEMVIKWTRNNDVYNNPNDLIVNNVSDTSNVILKTQELTFSLPILLDTIPEIYVIPVSQVSLAKPELYEPEFSPSMGRIRNKINFPRKGNFNNLIIFDGIKNERFPIFNEKINITSYQYLEISDSKYLLIIGGTKDSNGDNKLNNSDLKSFYVYNLGSRKLNTISFNDYGLISYSRLYGKDELILQYGHDKNKNGEFNSYEEPNILKRLTLSSMQAEDFIESELIHNAQNNIK
jgi:hypothetical protein